MSLVIFFLPLFSRYFEIDELVGKVRMKEWKNNRFPWEKKKSRCDR